MGKTSSGSRGGGGTTGPCPPPPSPDPRGSRPYVYTYMYARICVREHMQTQRKDIATAEMAYTYAYRTYIMIHGSGPSMNMIASGAFITCRNSIRLYNKSKGKRYVTLAGRLAYGIQFSLWRAYRKVPKTEHKPIYLRGGK